MIWDGDEKEQNSDAMIGGKMMADNHFLTLDPPPLRDF